MRILIIEDEQNAFEILQKRILQLLPNAQIMGHLTSIVESINWFIPNEMPDLVFLDVELADGRCFEIFKHVRVTCPVIFTTAYDQFAIDAFKLNSVDYLLKPISLGDLRKALAKLREMQQAFTSPYSFRTKPFSIRGKPVIRRRFLVHSGDTYFAIKAKEVAYLYSEDGVSFLKTLEGRRHMISETLDTLSKELDPDQFFRINRHQIVHIDSIQEIHEYFNRRFKLDILPDSSSEEFIVSRLRRAEFKDWLNR